MGMIPELDETQINECCVDVLCNFVLKLYITYYAKILSHSLGFVVNYSIKAVN